MHRATHTYPHAPMPKSASASTSAPVSGDAAASDATQADDTLADAGTGDAAPGHAPVAPARRPAVPAAAALRVSLDRIDELFRVSAEVSVHSAAMESRIKQLTERAKELLEQNLRVQKRLFELETVVDVRALSVMRAHGNRDSNAAFDPLEMDQYNELHSTAHALLEEASDAREIGRAHV
mgnify:CR=1 FL=1